MYTPEDIGPYVKNKENALRLIEWLTLGAHHTLFNLDYGSSSDENDILNSIETMLEIGALEGEPEDHVCGTVCCIAGAACQMHLGEFGYVNPTTNGLDWDEIEDKAFEFLGMEPNDRYNTGIWGLFNPDKWDRSPSGPEAACAIVEYSNSGSWRDAIATAQSE